ncbi:hypothetical protein PV433_11395 [Paenibacillus sp. GYB004]|uniref:hypothetical protein n=1 Tax=Paenibacillus sp. GYB004 TaxID=2994393 RepID=UPI002F968B35
MWQSELFPRASQKEVERVKFLLEHYIEMLGIIRDFEEHEGDLQQVSVDGEVGRRIDQDDLYADKTANAVFLHEKQQWVYQQYCFYTSHLRRAVALLREEDVRMSIEYRYFEGKSPKEVWLLFKRAMSPSTIRRKQNEGAEGIADTLKLMGFFEKDTTKF